MQMYRLVLKFQKRKKTVSESWLEDIIWQEQSLIGALKQVITQNVSTHLGLGSYPRLKIENMSPAFRSLTSPTGKPAEVRWGQCNSKTGKKILWRCALQWAWELATCLMNEVVIIISSVLSCVNRFLHSSAEDRVAIRLPSSAITVDSCWV